MLTFLNKSDYHHLLTGRTPMALNRLLLQELKNEKINLTREQLIILVALWENDKSSQQMLATATYRDKPSTTRLIDNLEKAGFLIRKADPNDRRINLVYLTKEGKEIKEKSLEVINRVLAFAVEGISIEELDVFKSCFDKIYANLEKKLNDEK